MEILMRKLFITLTLFMLPVALFAQSESKEIRLSEPVEVTENYEVFGSKFTLVDKPLSLNSVISNSNQYNEKEVLITTTISKVCQKKGCFFIAQDGELTARITFKDYSFFVPTKSSGKNVTIQGVFEKKIITESKAKHYAEDAGADPDGIKGDQVEYSIVATSVKIEK